MDLEKLGERTCIIDCDVIQADGGTRTAAISGGYVALRVALQRLVDSSQLNSDVFLSPIAAISVGVLEGQPILDLCYEEDSMADVDVNVVMNAHREFIEVQGTAEGVPFSRQVLNNMLNLAEQGITELLNVQQQFFQR